jgi:hypothetical protein
LLAGNEQVEKKVGDASEQSKKKELDPEKEKQNYV